MRYAILAMLILASSASAQTPTTGDDGYYFGAEPPKAKPAFPTYETFKSDKTYAVFVATNPRNVPGVPVCVNPYGFNGYPACIGVIRPDGKRDVWVATLPVTATDSEIRRAAGIEVGRLPSFFGLPTADGSVLATVPWPKSLQRPAGLVRYRPARYTQEIAVTNNRDRITPVPRNVLPEKWSAPGGLLGLAGWRSELYRYVPYGGEPFVANIPVWNGSNYQNNRGWQRTYPDGSLFADVLSNADTGKVFEVRFREKRNGEWDSFVAFTDRQQRPDGYVRVPNRKCADCHNNTDGPGTGGYASGLVPGSDTVISDPVAALERE